MSADALQECLEYFFDYKLDGLYTALPARVVTVHDELSECMVDVQPILLKLLNTGDTTEYPTILSVPVIFPSSSTSAVTFPISVGDTVLLVFAQRGIDLFKASDGSDLVGCGDYRKLDKRDAIAIPGLWSFKQSKNKANKHKLPHSTSDLCIAHNLGKPTEAEIRIRPDGTIALKTLQGVTVEANTALINAQTAVSIMAPQTIVSGDLTVIGGLSVMGGSSIANFTVTGNSTFTGNITMAGNFTQTGTYTLNGIRIDLHKHDTPSGLSNGPRNP